MKSLAQLRRMIKKYLKHPRAFTQNELARRCSMSPQTLSDFLLGKHNGITTEQERKLLDTIAPWEHDEICTAGRLKTSLPKQYYSKHEIAVIAMHLSSEGVNSGK